MVIDTNVLVSALLKPQGPPARVLDLFLSGQLTLLYDDRMLAEYQRVLLKPRFAFAPNDVNALLDFIVAAGELVVAPPAGYALPDTSDLPFLEVAISGQANALVTGNERHFVPLEGELPVKVYSPASFLHLWAILKIRG